MTALPSPPKYSVVVPFYNEAGNVADVLAALRGAAERWGVPYEVLLIDDGSADATGELLRAGCRNWPQARAVEFPFNVGQAGGLLFGMRQAAGEWVLLMDGDGQNDPADFEALLARTGEAELVVGVRAQRHDTWLRRAMSRLANAVRRRLLADGVSDTGCGLKVLHREVVPAMVAIRSLYSFIPALAASAGFRIAEAPVRHHPRRHGRSNYGLSVFLWRPAVDMLALWWLRQRRVPRWREAAARARVTPAAPLPAGEAGP